MLSIRLQRVGRKNRPDFRVVVMEKHRAVKKKHFENLGSYNPRSKQLVISSPDRLSAFISQNVDMSPTVHNLFVTNGFLSGAKIHSFSIPKKPEAPAAVSGAAPSSSQVVDTPASVSDSAAPAADSSSEESVAAETGSKETVAETVVA